MIDALHAHGWKVGVVSGGFHEVVDRLAADAHLDFWIANRLEAADGCLTGHVLGDIVTKDVKLQSLRDWASRMGISMGQTVAVGDGANDLPMIHAAGLGVAFCAKPAVQADAPHRVNERDLTGFLIFFVDSHSSMMRIPIDPSRDIAKSDIAGQRYCRVK